VVIDTYSCTKNVACVEFHRDLFGVPGSAPLDTFLRLVERSEGCTVESSCKVEAGHRYSARWNLFYHSSNMPAFASSVRRFLNEVADNLRLPLDFGSIDRFIGQDFDFTRLRKIITGIDLRPDLDTSRLKAWFMLARYPEAVARAIDLHGNSVDVERLILHDEFLIGFDLPFGGGCGVKLYPDIRSHELKDPLVRGFLASVLSARALTAMEQCLWTHVYISRNHIGRVLQFHPTDPDGFVERYLDRRLAQPIHDVYRSTSLLDMVVAFREADLENLPIRDFAIYYMPGEPPGRAVS
jgi:LynF/TruF/PatF family peptide O-prenyltransferase